jgi:hypothetical protein
MVGKAHPTVFVFSGPPNWQAASKSDSCLPLHILRTQLVGGNRHFLNLQSGRLGLDPAIFSTELLGHDPAYITEANWPELRE